MWQEEEEEEEKKKKKETDGMPGAKAATVGLKKPGWNGWRGTYKKKKKK